MGLGFRGERSLELMSLWQLKEELLPMDEPFEILVFFQNATSYLLSTTPINMKGSRLSARPFLLYIRHDCLDCEI